MSHNSNSRPDKLNGWLGWVQTKLAEVSGFLLMLGLVISMMNFLLDDALFKKAPPLEFLWALFQSLAVDANLAIVFGLLVIAMRNKEYIKGVVYGILGLLLVFTAVVITNTEAVRQALSVTLSAAFGQVHVPILVLTWIRSIVAVGLVAVSGVPMREAEQPQVQPQPKPKRVKAVTSPNPVPEQTNGHTKTSAQKYAEFVTLHKTATIPQIIEGTGLSRSTVMRLKKRHDELTEVPEAGLLHVPASN